MKTILLAALAVAAMFSLPGVGYCAPNYGLDDEPGLYEQPDYSLGEDAIEDQATPNYWLGTASVAVASALRGPVCGITGCDCGCDDTCGGPCHCKATPAAAKKASEWKRIAPTLFEKNGQRVEAYRDRQGQWRYRPIAVPRSLLMFAPLAPGWRAGACVGGV